MPERLAPNEWLKKWTHDEIGRGRDIVVMHGAPLLHGVEVYHGRPIFYDLGTSFTTCRRCEYIDEPMAWESVVASVQLGAESQGKLKANIRGSPSDRFRFGRLY